MKQNYLVTLFLLIFAYTNGQTIADYRLLIVSGALASDAKTELQALGHTVTIETPTNLVSSYNYSNYDVIIFMYDSAQPAGMPQILSLNTNNQLGIVLMRGQDVINSCNMGTAVNWSNTGFTIENNTHFITQPFSLGALDLSFDYKSNITAISPGNTILGSVSSGNGSLVVNNTYRRVMSPYYGHTSGMPWSSNAALLMDRIIAWAAYKGTLGLTEKNPVSKMTIFPNPSTQEISVNGLTELKSFKIYNVLGQMVKQGTLPKGDKINVQDLKSGVYYLKFDDSDTKLKFIRK